MQSAGRTDPSLRANGPRGPVAEIGPDGAERRRFLDRSTKLLIYAPPLIQLFMPGTARAASPSPSPGGKKFMTPPNGAPQPVGPQPVGPRPVGAQPIVPQPVGPQVIVPPILGPPGVVPGRTIQ